LELLEPQKLQEPQKNFSWRLSHSLWIGWTFSLSFFNWIAFFYAGTRAKKPDWLGYGLFYMIPFLLIILGPESGLGWDTGLFLTIPMGILSIVHAFKIREEYLQRLAAIERKELIDESVVLEDLQAELTGKPSRRSRSAKAKTGHSRDRRSAAEKEIPSIPSVPAGSPSLVDVNHDEEQAIAMLPGFDMTMARKAVIIRQMTGAYESVEDFGRALSLTEEHVEQIRPNVVFRSLAGETGVVKKLPDLSEW